MESMYLYIPRPTFSNCDAMVTEVFEYLLAAQALRNFKDLFIRKVQKHRDQEKSDPICAYASHDTARNRQYAVHDPHEKSRSR